MSNAGKPDLSLFLDILHTLDRIGAPYMIIGGFAATMYGITRTTFDDEQAARLGAEVFELWDSIKTAARAEAKRGDDQPLKTS